MAANLLSCNYEDEEFIDMEVSSSPHANSPSKSREFEFQMASSNVHSNSPADELFYKGKLLPLHLPPRAQMVKSLLLNSKFKQNEEQQEQEFITFSTPMVQSCNISPSESCRVSTELTPDEYFFEWSTELTGFIGDHPKKYYGPWSKKLRLIKNSSLTQKLKASRMYIKSLFNKTGCGSDGNPCVKQEVEQDCDNNFLKKYLKVTKKTSFGQLQTGKYPTLSNVLKGIEEQGNEDVFYSNCSHRKSFSGSIKRKCTSSLTMTSSSSTSCSSTSASGSSSSSSSFNYSNNNGIYDLKRNSSADSEVESSIEAAIDHCKKSHQENLSTYSLPPMKINEKICIFKYTKKVTTLPILVSLSTYILVNLLKTTCWFDYLDSTAFFLFQWSLPTTK
ncbi:probable membrane-associated kinase regulator 4 [Rutidosis leptorrhynchoides]|uniref:probable membrane-associated kinase regulator 4 n=1 Tax=Rutidosis leptorrhynchoides TaxID=125765 RepID=UPI003A999BD7